ncbi:ORF 4 [Haloarcula hispanica virus SH1]|uniref:ORF 4 n=1 Tax=Haloarcula hispanica SH1 virus TaxID=326574 RepID=Q4KPI3_9VIRU|nr:ORF 4 [Haloarcula hispanica virus SH1]AAY24930.1 ORF 4 [Haloarcula hispanica virus SH1]
MPSVTRLTESDNRAEGFAVETESGGTTYRYEFEVVEERDPEADDEEGRMGTVEFVARFEDGAPSDLSLTGAAREAMNDYGFTVEQ